MHYNRTNFTINAFATENFRAFTDAYSIQIYNEIQEKRSSSSSSQLQLCCLQG